MRRGAITTHSVVIGELAAGNLSRRPETLEALRALSRTPEVTFDECLAFVAGRRLHGLGVGWSDVQLVAAARLAHVPLWSLDVRLAGVARRLGIAHVPA